MVRKKVKQSFMLLLIKAQSKVLKRKLEKQKNKTYIVDMDKETQKRVEKIISDTRAYVQGQIDSGANLIEVAQVMLAMSREAIVDAYGEQLADSYIHTQISRLQNDEKEPTIH